jgi:hypothetical protein
MMMDSDGTSVDLPKMHTAVSKVSYTEIGGAEDPCNFASRS